MGDGYAGKIARLNLNTKAITTIDTAKYEEFGGGFGIGAAIFWDFALAPGKWYRKNAYDPQNIIILMSGPLAAIGVPGAVRTSVCGLSPGVYPSHTFYRANFGGRFAETMEIGRKIWNLERAIRVLQGRRRDQEKFFPYVYMPGLKMG